MNKVLKLSIDKLIESESLKLVCRNQEENYPMPSVDTIENIVKLLRAIFFPGFYGNSDVNIDTIQNHIEANIYQLFIELKQQIKSGICFENIEEKYHCTELDKKTDKIVSEFISRLPEMRSKLHKDAKAAYNGDPAAKSLSEIIFCYPGIRAIINYRVAHELLILGVPIIPRIITELAHSETGIDIHPGAKIGESFMIDHGTGVVIGETAQIGDNVRIYQGVTLGARSFPLDDNGNPIKGIDRHPKIGNGVVLYSNTTLLGNIRIGDGAIIGGNLWVDYDVSAGEKIHQKK